MIRNAGYVGVQNQRKPKKSLGNNNLTVHEVAGYNEAMKFRKSANFKVIGIVRGPV